MRKFYGNSCQVHIDELVDVIKKLYQFYAAEAPSSSRPKSGSNEPGDTDTADLLVDNRDEELESFLYDNDGANGDDMNELDKYMADPPLRLSGQFDILAWWKNQTDEYPVLAKIARDLLAEVSTVASESAFSAGGRVADPFRSRLDPVVWGTELSLHSRCPSTKSNVATMAKARSTTLWVFCAHKDLSIHFRLE